jgi:hypothetical protein
MVASTVGHPLKLMTIGTAKAKQACHEAKVLNPRTGAKTEIRRPTTPYSGP